MAVADLQLLRISTICRSGAGRDPISVVARFIKQTWIPACAGTTAFGRKPVSVDRLSMRLAEANASKHLANRRSTLQNARGFSLLEILVALTLLALAMGVLMQIFSRGVNSAALADRYAKATMYAESKLATIGVEQELKETAATGKFDDDFSWGLVVRPYLDPNPKEPSVIDFEKLMPTQLYEIELRVTFMADDQRERAVNLSTLRIGPKA